MVARTAVVLLVLALAAPAFAARLLNEAPDTTLTCVQSVLKDAEGKELSVSGISTLSQKRVNSVQSSVGSQGEAQCLRMKVVCDGANNINLCTAAETEAKATKVAQMLTTSNVCKYYKQYAENKGFVQDVFCCATNNCNA